MCRGLCGNNTSRLVYSRSTQILPAMTVCLYLEFQESKANNLVPRTSGLGETT